MKIVCKVYNNVPVYNAEKNKINYILKDTGNKKILFTQEKNEIFNIDDNIFVKNELVKIIDKHYDTEQKQYIYTVDYECIDKIEDMSEKLKLFYTLVKDYPPCPYFESIYLSYVLNIRGITLNVKYIDKTVVNLLKALSLSVDSDKEIYYDIYGSTQLIEDYINERIEYDYYTDIIYYKYFGKEKSKEFSKYLYDKKTVRKIVGNMLKWTWKDTFLVEKER